jgi:hypothetical protein
MIVLTPGQAECFVQHILLSWEETAGEAGVHEDDFWSHLAAFQTIE